MKKPQPSVYERTAIVAIHEWKNPTITWWDSAMRVISAPFDFASDVAMKVPGVEYAIEKAFGGALTLLNDGATYTVRRQAILASFTPPLTSLEEVHALDLEQVDRTIGYLAAKYKGLALAQGAAAGGVGSVNPVVGAAAIGADVTGLLTLNLRAIGEYATYYGFDIGRQEERLFALNVLGLASSPSDAAKAVV